MAALATSIDLIQKYHTFSLPTPYEVKNKIRFLRNTNKLASSKLKVIAINTQLENENKTSYFSFSDCSKALKTNRTKIKFCILSGETYKGYKNDFLPPTRNDKI